MDINQVLMDYDNMFGTHSLEDIEEFLTTNIEVAMDERDYASAEYACRGSARRGA